MELSVTELDPTTQRLNLSGRLDAMGAEAIETRFTATLCGADRSTIIDLQGVDFVASLGLRLFIGAARVVQRRGRQVVLFGAQPMVAAVFETIALGQMIPVVATEAEAVARLAA